MKGTTRRATFWVAMLLGVAVIVALVVRYRPEAIFAPLLHSDPWILVAVLGLVTSIRLLSAITPVVLLGRPEAGELSWWTRARVFLAMQPLSLLPLGRLSDFGVLPILKSHYRTGALASSIVLDRLITVLVLLLMMPAAIRLSLPSATSRSADIAALTGLLLVAAIPFLLVNRRVRSVVNRVLLRRWPRAFEGFGSHTTWLLRSRPKRLLANVMLTAAKPLLSGAGLSLLAVTLGVPLDLITAIGMSVLVQLATSIPISAQGIGVAEVSLVLLFALAGLPEPLAVSISLVLRVFMLIVLGFLYVTATVPIVNAHLEQA